MFDPAQYCLIDFGDGQKLESFAGTFVLRDSKAVGDLQMSQRNWPEPACISSRFKLRDSSSGQGNWSGLANSLPLVCHGLKKFRLRPTATGQVGLFPEQAINWGWIENRCRTLAGLKALNLFAYTGGTTLSLASQGAAVVHLDAASSVVRWARENASLSLLEDRPIRWIVDDALKFLGREARRGNKYQILVADPPSFGRGPGGETWRFEEHIESLVVALREIAADELGMLILSGHTSDYDGQQLLQLVKRNFDTSAGKLESLSLDIEALDGRRLNCGFCVRYLSAGLAK